MPHSAIIIGAGPAGSVAAIRLSRAGWQVRLIEQHRFPRDKVCGECVSALGVDVLERLGVPGYLNPVLLTRALVFDSSGQALRLHLPAPMWGVERSVLDCRLLDLARDAGASVHQPARCESIDAGHVVIRDLQSNSVSNLSDSLVLLADGKGRRASGDLGLKAHFAHVDFPGDAIGLFGVRGHYLGVAAVGVGKWNIACSVPARRVRRFEGNLDRLFEQIVSESRALSRAMHTAGRVSPWKSSPLPRSDVARQWPLGVIPLGNAACSIEPIGGEGIGLAMRSAEIAAEHLILTDGRPDVGFLRRQYRTLWSARPQTCRAAAIALSKPMLAKTSLGIARALPGLSRMVLRAMGKSAVATISHRQLSGASAAAPGLQSDRGRKRRA